MAILPFTPEQNRKWHNALPAKPAGADMICINNEGKMLAVKASYKNHWSLPGGVVDEGESPRAAAIRELYEEVAITLNASQAQFADVIYYPAKDGKRDVLNFLFVARGVNAVPVPDNHEIVEAKWMTPEEFKTLCGERTHLLRAADVASNSVTTLYVEGT